MAGGFERAAPWAVKDVTCCVGSALVSSPLSRDLTHGTLVGGVWPQHLYKMVQLVLPTGTT